MIIFCLALNLSFFLWSVNMRKGNEFRAQVNIYKN